MKPITPLILGSGMSGQAIAKSLAILNTQNPAIDIAIPYHLKRGESLTALRAKFENPLLFIANPHGLHAKTILEAVEAGFTHIVCEKPVCVNIEEVRALRDVKIPVAVLHGYRVMWGPEEIKRKVLSGELGEIISIEGRYWQSSAAARAVSSGSAKPSWKNDTSLSGTFDVLLDLSTHWLDLASYVIGSIPSRIVCRRMYANAEASHRDTHNHISLEFPNGVCGMTSVSKTAHGATNDLDITILGTKGSASWSFLKPDELILGSGASRQLIARQDRTLGSGMPSFHAMGWIEGYLQICNEMLVEMNSGKPGCYPRLPESLDLLEKLFSQLK